MAMKLLSAERLWRELSRATGFCLPGAGRARSSRALQAHTVPHLRALGRRRDTQVTEQRGAPSCTGRRLHLPAWVVGTAMTLQEPV